MSCILLEQIRFIWRGGGTRRPGNDKISQAKGQTIKVSHDCIVRGKQAALTTKTKVGKMAGHQQSTCFENPFMYITDI